MWKGSDTWSCERTGEDPRGDPQEREMDDWPEWDELPKGGELVPFAAVDINYRELAIANARAQAAAVTDPEKRRQAMECVEVVEMVKK